MKLSKSIKYFLKQSICWSMNLSLVFPLHLYAQDRGSQNNLNGNGFGSALNIIGGAASAGASILSNYKNSQVVQEQMRQTQMALTPIEFENRYFPGCKTLPAMMSSVYGLCESQPATQAEAQMFQAFGQQAAKNRNNYERYTTLGNKEFINHGMSCVQDRIKSTKDLLEQRVVGLRELLNKVTTEKNNLDNALRPQKDAIAELEGYLNGGEKKESDHTRKYSNLFRQVANDASCGAFMDSVNVEKHARKGLVNIEKEVNKVRTGGQGDTDLVTNLLRNQGNLQASINKYASDVRQSLQKRGVASSLDELAKNNMNVNINNPLLVGSPAITAIQNDVVRQFKDERASLDQSFDRLGQPGLKGSVFADGDHNFQEKIRQWRNDKQNECLMKKISVKNTGKAYETFVGNITHVDANVRSKTNINSLQNELLNHLQNDRLSIREKQKLVKKSVASKSSRRVRIMSYDTIDGTQDQKDWDPAALLGTYVDTCLQEYDRIRVNGEGQSLKAVENEAKKIYTEYKKMEKNYPQQVAKAITDKMIHCHQDGKPIPYSITSSSCNSDKLNIGNSNFCLGQSVECAKTVNLCSKKIDDTIQKVTKTQQDVANSVNNTVQTFVNYQKQLVEQLKQASLAQAKQLEQLFPNSKFHLPEDLSIVDPEKVFQLDGDKIGVAVLDADEIMVQFSDKIRGLAKQVEDQNKKVIAEIESEKQKIETNYQNEIGRWADVESKCMQGFNAYNQREGEERQQAEQERQELIGKLDQFCKKFSTYRLAPGCDEPLEDLEETTWEIKGAINVGEVSQMIGSVRANCLEAQREKDVQEHSNQYGLTIAAKCKSLKNESGYPGQESCSQWPVTHLETDETEINRLYTKHILKSSDSTERKPASASIAENRKYTMPITIPHCESRNDVSYSFSDIGGLFNGVNDLTHAIRQ